MVALHIAYLIANTYGGGLAWDEFYKVPYSQAGETYTFAACEGWEVVELTYQPNSTPEIAEAKQAAALPAQSRPREQADGRLVWCEVGVPAGSKPRSARSWPTSIFFGVHPGERLAAAF